MIYFRCLDCRRKLAVKDDWAGKRIVCPRCNNKEIAPARSEEEAPEPVVARIVVPPPQPPAVKITPIQFEEIVPHSLEFLTSRPGMAAPTHTELGPMDNSPSPTLPPRMFTELPHPTFGPIDPFAPQGYLSFDYNHTPPPPGIPVAPITSSGYLTFDDNPKPIPALDPIVPPTMAGYLSIDETPKPVVVPKQSPIPVGHHSDGDESKPVVVPPQSPSPVGHHSNGDEPKSVVVPPQSPSPVGHHSNGDEPKPLTVSQKKPPAPLPSPRVEKFNDTPPFPQKWPSEKNMGMKKKSFPWVLASIMAGGTLFLFGGIIYGAILLKDQPNASEAPKASLTGKRVSLPVAVNK